MLYSRLTLRGTPGLLLSLYLLVIYLPDIEANLGDACPICTGTNETCINGTCVCEEGFYDSNGNASGGTCYPKVDLGSYCTNVTGEQVCKDPNAVCPSVNCECSFSYYDVNGPTPGGTCQLKVDLGANCSNVADVQVCKDFRAACSNGKCACGSNYYDDNGVTPAGTCQLTTNLRVTSLVYGKITENTIQISWTPPNDRAAVSYFRVAYWPANTITVVNQTNVGNQTSVVLNNLDPGKKYSISVFSVNTQTDLTERSTSVTQNQTTKPGIPGALFKDFDIDASSGNITLQWYSSIGIVTGYGGSLENITLFKYSRVFRISGIISSQVFSEVKSGTWYTFVVQAFVGYADTQTVYSDVRTQLIKTRVQAPNPPTNLSCLDATDRAITLKWIQPLLPNGDIFSYIIVIQRTQPSQEPYNVTSKGTNVQYIVNGLTAGSLYTFQVYTVNENYTSTSSAEVTSCTTKPQKVDLGSNCINVTGEQVCKDPNAVCTGVKCECISNYYDVDGPTPGGTCQLKIDLGSNCSNVTGERVCKDANAECSGDKCRCGYSYYDNNGALPAGTCQLTTNLQVTSVVYGTITERSIPISWTPPDDTAAVSYYSVAYWPADTTTINNQQNVGNQTSFVFINLDPGKKYSIRIFTVNTQTDLTERSTSVTKNQTTKPGIPGALFKDFDIDASSGNITLQWYSSIGVVTGYGGSLENITLFKYSRVFIIPGIISSQTFSEVKSGTWYTFVVQAFLGYADTKTVYSDVRTQLIKTRVQAPNPPTNLSCLDATDRSITLKWIQPLLPNGDIILYIIVIQRTQPSQEPYNITSKGTNVQYIVNGLTAGSFYTFKVYTVNENYTSTSFAEATSCATKPQMAEPPKDLLITNVTSRSGVVTWNRPSILGTLYGYSLHILNDSSCVREVIWRCNDCPGAFPSLPSPCLNVSQLTASSTELLGPQYYEAVTLFPDTNYTVDVAAITGIGIGFKASKNLPTKEEAPSKPSIVLIRNITAKTAIVEWNMNEVRPGQTNYIIIAEGNSPAETMIHSVSGFFNRNYLLIDLEEDWKYHVIVEANTNIGSNQSDSYSFNTLPGPAGPVSLFRVDKGFGEDEYVTAVLSWEPPLDLDRNGPIDKFYVQQNVRNNPSISKILIVQSDEMYTATFSVVPEENYIFMIRAANDYFNGTDIVQEYVAPAGPPINTIENQGIPVIPLESFSSTSQTSFQIEINDDFFMDTKNGATKMKGLICCKKCNKANSTIMKPKEIDSIKTYTQAQKLNLNQYRLPVPTANLISGEKGLNARRKRSVTVYHVGIESCAGKSDSYFCNGPLTPNTSYSIIVFVCTSGACTLSNSYGPFITLADSDKNSNTGSTSMDTPVIVGIVCGTFFLTILVIACTIIIIRATRITRRSTETNTGDTYMDLACRTNEEPVYDSIQAES